MNFKNYSSRPGVRRPLAAAVESVRPDWVEGLEGRTLFTGGVIVHDAFTYGPAWTGRQIAGQSPSDVNRPGGTYQTAAGFDYDQQVLGTNTGAFSNSAYFHNIGAAAINLASHGSYTKPTTLEVSGRVAFDLAPGYTTNAFLGFYSSVPSGFNGSDLKHFSGLQLNSKGDLTLVVGGVVAKTVRFTGTYRPDHYARLSYDVDTLTGAIGHVALTGSSSDYSQLTTAGLASGGFTNGATAYGGIGGDNADSGRVHFDHYQVAAGDASTPTPPPTPSPPTTITAVRLDFEQSPSNSVVNLPIVPPVTVNVEDASGHVVTGDGSAVTLSINTGGGTLTGTTTVTAVNGVATFTNLVLPAAGTYTLQAVATALASATSTAFTVTSPAAGPPVVVPPFPVAAPTVPVRPINWPDTVLSNTNPFGVSSSHQSTNTYAAWGSDVALAGAKWVRMFPEWREIQPTAGAYDWSTVDAVTRTAAANNQYVSGILYYNADWVNSNTGTFPTNNLSAWKAYVSAVVAHTAGKVEHWEVWNEPQNFSSGAAPQDYGTIVAAAYDAAKAVDPNAQIGLNVASVDLVYLEQAIRAGAAGHYDFVTVHPYEVLGTVAQGWEGDYLSIVPTVRKMLAANDPAKASVPIWFTVLGEQLGYVNGPQTVTTASQAQDLVKSFTMGLAEGVARLNWYEAKDGDTGFGLIDLNGNKRPAYTALQSLTTYLGTAPRYLGWTGLNGADNAFVFQGATTSVMAAWAQPNTTDSLSFGSPVRVVNPSTGGVTYLSAGSTLALTNAPVLIVGVPADVLAQAQANQGKPFSWGGDYTNASSVSVQFGPTNTDAGLHQLSPNQTTQSVYVYGGPARLANSSYTDQYQSFEVDPNFLSYTPGTVNVTVVARRDESNYTAGFDLGYESTTGLKHSTDAGRWTIPGNDRWYSHTFTLTDAEFNSKWGYNFSINSDNYSSGRFYLQSVTVTKG